MCCAVGSKLANKMQITLGFRGAVYIYTHTHTHQVQRMKCFVSSSVIYSRSALWHCSEEVHLYTKSVSHTGGQRFYFPDILLVSKGSFKLTL